LLGKVFSLSLIMVLGIGLVISTSNAEIDHLKPLSESNLDLNLPKDSGYFALRCSALSAAQFRVLSSDPPSQQVVKELHERFFTISVRSYLVVTKLTEPSLLEDLANKVLNFTNSYSKVMETTFQNTGDYFDGNPLIEKDTNDCSAAAQQLLSK
tara:strand:- start:1099 stop:1560 length:462 start_codon:yes stop_codon:yes gene_type:complete